MNINPFKLALAFGAIGVLGAGFLSQSAETKKPVVPVAAPQAQAPAGAGQSGLFGGFQMSRSKTPVNAAPPLPPPVAVQPPPRDTSRDVPERGARSAH